METLEKINKKMNHFSEDPLVNIFKEDEFTYDITIHWELMDSYWKLGDIQKEIDELCYNKYTLKTIFGDRQNARFIIKKN